MYSSEINTVYSATIKSREHPRGRCAFQPIRFQQEFKAQVIRLSARMQRSRQLVTRKFPTRSVLFPRSNEQSEVGNSIHCNLSKKKKKKNCL